MQPQQIGCQSNGLELKGFEFGLPGSATGAISHRHGVLDLFGGQLDRRFPKSMLVQSKSMRRCFFNDRFPAASLVPRCLDGGAEFDQVLFARNGNDE